MEKYINKGVGCPGNRALCCPEETHLSQRRGIYTTIFKSGAQRRIKDCFVAVSTWEDTFKSTSV